MYNIDIYNLFCSPCDMTDHNPILPEDARIVRIKDTEYVAIHKYWWDKEKKRGQQKIGRASCRERV